MAVTAGGKKLGGTLDADGATWKSTGTMSYGKTYKVTATILDSTGAEVQKTSTFSTLKPSSIAGITFQANGLGTLRSGGTYGMGQPVIVAFSHSVTDKSAAEKAIDIETTPSVKGKFFWVSSKIVHWRPASYWASSNGRGGYTTGAQGQSIHFWTQNGPHVVLSREAQHTMSSASYGVENPKDPFYYAPEVVKLCTRISYSGEFLHAAPWNHQLGRANISHGCINLSIADAQWVYDNFIIGDVVNVVNSPKELPITDGLGDWTVSYDKY